MISSFSGNCLSCIGCYVINHGMCVCAKLISFYSCMFCGLCDVVVDGMVIIIFHLHRHDLGMILCFITSCKQKFTILYVRPI